MIKNKYGEHTRLSRICSETKCQTDRTVCTRIYQQVEPHDGDSKWHSDVELDVCVWMCVYECVCMNVCVWCVDGEQRFSLLCNLKL